MLFLFKISKVKYKWMAEFLPYRLASFLEEETVTEALNNAPTINDDNSEKEYRVL